MIPVSNEYRRQLISGNRKWLTKVNITLADGTLLNLDNENIWEGGITIDEAISSDSSFDIGAAVIGSLQVVIDNITGNYSTYDFYDARLVLWLGVEGDIDEFDVQRYYRKGFYVVDKPSYNGSLITLECLDNMVWFDTPFDEVTGITYPATAGTVVQAICSHVGVTLGTPAFPSYSSADTTITKKPEQKLNCREVLQYIAQMCCCYCKISTAGQLILNWYDKNAIIGLTDYDGGTYNTTTTPYSDGCDLDGGHFMYGGDSADGGLFSDLLETAYISNNFQIGVSTDDVVVTGCRVRNNTSKDNSFDELWVDPVIEQDHERYVLVIENNPFIVSQAQAANIANVVGNTLAGLPIRGFQASALSDFSYETGDMAVVIDFRGNRYYTWLTSFTFTSSISEDFSCGVESLRTRSSQRFSGTVKTLAEANENAEEILTAYDNAVKAMDALAQASIGYNEYVYPVNAGVGTARTMWRYNGSQRTGTASEPLFPNSTVVFKIAGDGVFVSHDGGVTYDNGYDANSGTAILNLLYAQGIVSDWIQANAITSSKISAGAITAGKISVSTLDAITANMGSLTAGTITGTSVIKSYRGNVTTNGYTEVSGGSVKIATDSNNYFQVNYNYNGNDARVTFGEYISVRDEIKYSPAVYDEFYYGDFFHALNDAKNAHRSDKKTKKNIKNIPIENSRNIVLSARPRYFEFKDTTEPSVRSGFVAQELRKSLDKFGDATGIERESYRRKGEREVLYEDFIAHLVNTTQDLYSEVEELKKQLAELKARIK